jgi:hypothetical protein
VIASIVLFSVNTLDSKLYKPEEFGNIVTGQTQDVKRIISVLGNDIHGVGHKDMNKALQNLEKGISLTNIKGKKNIKNVKGNQRIEFLGYPSVYKLPSDISYLKMVLSNQRIVGLIIEALKRMGVLNNLAFFLEGYFHIVRFTYEEDEKTTEITKLRRKMVDNDEWRPDIAEPLLVLDELNLKLAAKKVAELLMEIPSFYYKLLLIVLTLA